VARTTEEYGMKIRFENSKLRSGFLKVVLLSLGIGVAALGIALTYKSGIGTNPMATVTDGVSRLLSVNYGTANLLINTMFLIVALFLQRDKVFVGTFVLVFTMGIYINFFVNLLSTIALSNMWSIPINLVGTVITAFGISVVVIVDYGLGPLDLMTEVINRKFQCSYRTAKTVFDSSLLLVGIGMGGVYGLGTLFNVLLVGMLMQSFFELYRKIKFKTI